MTEKDEKGGGFHAVEGNKRNVVGARAGGCQAARSQVRGQPLLPGEAGGRGSGAGRAARGRAAPQLPAPGPPLRGAILQAAVAGTRADSAAAAGSAVLTRGGRTGTQRAAAR